MFILDTDEYDLIKPTLQLFLHLSHTQIFWICADANRNRCINQCLKITGKWHCASQVNLNAVAFEHLYFKICER